MIAINVPVLDLGKDFRGEDPRGEYIGMCFELPNGEDRQALVIKTLTEVAHKMGSDLKHRPVVTLTMPCGEYVTYETLEDVPLVDVACSCGDPKHAFIKWYEM